MGHFVLSERDESSDRDGKIVITFGKYRLDEVDADCETNAWRVKNGMPARHRKSVDILEAPKSWQRKLWENTESWNKLPSQDSSGYSDAACFRLSNVIRATIYFRYDVRSAHSDRAALYKPVTEVCDCLDEFEDTFSRINRIINDGIVAAEASSVSVKPVFKAIMVFRDLSYETYMGPIGKFMDRLDIDHSPPDRVIIKRRG